MKNWIKTEGLEASIVLTSRIRLARNLNTAPFPDRISAEGGRNIISTIEEVFFKIPEIGEDYKSIHLWQQGDTENRIFMEKYLISQKLLNNGNKSAVIINKEETVSIMLNEEDHIRLQTITAGLNLEETYEMASRLDDFLEENLTFAYDEKLGYLTACPTNLGTGLRASVMIHLPALAINNELNRIFNAVTKVGMTIRGLYGEGSKSEGALFQISNQLTLGISEKDIIDNLNAVVNQVISQEKLARNQMLKIYKYELKDKIFRSLGLLKTAVLLESKECLNLLSNVRMGVEMGIIKDVSRVVLNSLLVEMQPATLQEKFGKELSNKERNFNRANLIRERLSQNK
jgi:protein arginine kinase